MYPNPYLIHLSMYSEFLHVSLVLILTYVTTLWNTLVLLLSHLFLFCEVVNFIVTYSLFNERTYHISEQSLFMFFAYA